MGIVTFLLPDPLPEEVAQCLNQACLAIGYDQGPVPTRRTVENGRLLLTKEAHESGYLMTPWPVEGHGTPVCLTATLRERPEPYYLTLELARGKLNQVRNRAAEWESIGMAIDGIESASFLTEEQKRDIFYHNAVRFLRLDERSLVRPPPRR